MNNIILFDIIHNNYYDNKYKLFFLYYIIKILYRILSINNYMDIDFNVNILLNDNFWLSNYNNTELMKLDLFLDSQTLKPIKYEISKILSSNDYTVNKYSIITIQKSLIININDFDIISNNFYQLSLNSKLYLIYSKWLSDVNKHIYNNKENIKLHNIIDNFIKTHNLPISLIPNLNNISYKSIIITNYNLSYDLYSKYVNILNIYNKKLN